MRCTDIILAFAKNNIFLFFLKLIKEEKRMNKNAITNGFDEIDRVKTKVDSKLLFNYTYNYIH